MPCAIRLSVAIQMAIRKTRSVEERNHQSWPACTSGLSGPQEKTLQSPVPLVAIQMSIRKAIRSVEERNHRNWPACTSGLSGPPLYIYECHIAQ